jgi:hypothetical protein
MTRLTTFIALAITLSAALTACQNDTESTESIMAPTIVRSANDVAQINDQTQLAELSRVTAKFHRIETAKEAGYSAQITPCWAHHSAGGMGYHFGNTNLFDATVDLLNPETVIYEPQAGGHMRLVGMEYIVPIEAWGAAGHDLNNPNDVPQLLEQRFTRHSFLPIFKLHIWLCKKNPSGRFADCNPMVSFHYGEESNIF